MLLIDAGTSYIKVLEDDSNKLSIYPIVEKELYCNLRPDVITGHNSALFPNTKKVSELLALAHGTKKIIKEDSFTVLDVGSRDMKLVSYKNGEFDKCDWNTSCGAMIGFTIELITKYFDRTHIELPNTKKTLDITCGLLGITKFFDGISKNESIDENLSALINGMASYAWHFSGKPSSLYLSGGLCDNRTFVQHLNKLVPQLHTLGRKVLLEGLRS